MEDYYSLLGVSKSATEKEIKSAYRKKALQWHPDRNKDNKEESEKMFKKINKAYETLSNEDKRAAYDRMGHQAYEQYGGQAGGPAGGAGGQGQWGQQGPFSYTYTGNPQDFGFDFSDPLDIFEQFFGRSGGAYGGQARARRAIYTMKLSFDEAVHGVEKETVINGKNRTIKIPAGVDSGMRIRFEDFDVQVDVSPHSFFKREEQNVIYETKLTLIQAITGDVIEVPTIDKPVKLKVKPGTQPNTIIRLKGQGIPYPQSKQRGDQYVVFKVTIPKQISAKGKKLLKELEKELS